MCSYYCVVKLFLIADMSRLKSGTSVGFAVAGVTGKAHWRRNPNACNGDYRKLPTASHFSISDITKKN